MSSKSVVKYTNITYDININQFKKTIKRVKQKQKCVSLLINFERDLLHPL